MPYIARKGAREMIVPDALMSKYAELGYELRPADDPETVAMPAKRTTYTAAEYEAIKAERDAYKAAAAEPTRTQANKKAEAASERAGW